MTAEPPVPTSGERAGTSTEDRRQPERDQVRGGSMMLVGRVLSMVLNLVVQVTVVRYLGRTDYGVFTYAMAISAMGSSAALLGQDQVLGRFLSRDDEADDAAGAQATVVVAFVSVFAFGSVIAATVIGLHAIGIDLSADEAAVSVLLILIATAPFLGLDELLHNLFAVVARPSAIFFRRYVLTPGMRVAAVFVIVITGGSVEQLAWAYLLIAVVGVVVYMSMLVTVVREHRLARRVRRRRYRVRETVAFGAPVYASDLVMSFRQEFVVVLLEAMRSVSDVATFRAVLPVARVNFVALDSFRLLYYPAVSRLFARSDLDGVRRLYWQSAAWVAVGSFPVFVVTFTLARPVTELAFGPEFASSASVLAVLSIGLYLTAAFGLNTHTLRASGRTRLLLAIDGATAVVTLAAAAVFIHWWGALGAAVASTVAILFQNVCTHLGLRRVLGGLPLPPEHRRTYASVLGAGTVLTAVEAVASPPLALFGTAAAVVAAAVVVVNRRALDVGNTFPELARLPVVRRLLR